MLVFSRMVPTSLVVVEVELLFETELALLWLVFVPLPELVPVEEFEDVPVPDCVPLLEPSECEVDELVVELVLAYVPSLVPLLVPELFDVLVVWLLEVPEELF